MRRALAMAAWCLCAALALGEVPIRVDGNRALSDAELAPILEDVRKDIADYGLSAASAEDAAFFAGLHYRKRGYAFAEVTGRIAGGGLVLEVNEGPRVELGAIRVTGSNDLDPEMVKDYVIGPTRERFSVFVAQGQLPFVQVEVDNGLANLRGHLENEGYLDAVVHPAEIAFSADRKTADITVRADTGKRYRFGKLEFEGDLVFYPNDELLATLAPLSNGPFTRNTLIALERAVGHFYQSRGYFETKVETFAEPAAAGPDGLVPVRFRVASGPVYRFGDAQFSGLERTRSRFMEKRFAGLKNAFYSPDLVDAAFRDLMRAGIFRRLNITPTPAPEGRVNLLVDVEEAPAREFGLSLGYGSFEGMLVGFSVADRNLFGNGRPLTASVELAENYQKTEVLYRDPWLFDTDLVLRLRGYALTANLDGYDKTEQGVRAEVQKALSGHWTASVFVHGRRLALTSTGMDEADLGPAETLLVSAGLTQTFDRRDSALNPRRGDLFAVGLEVAQDAGGEDVRFLRSTGRYSRYLPFGKNLLAFGARVGYLVDFGGGVPVDERYFNGGSRTVRSFRERKLGPKSRQGYPVGGYAFSVFNIEMVFPLFDDVDAAVFADAGSVGDTGDFLAADLQFAVGAGIRYKLPVGPIRLDLAWNPTPRGDDAIGAVHFSVGFAF